jgi:hypothetical protein
VTRVGLAHIVSRCHPAYESPRRRQILSTPRSTKLNAPPGDRAGRSTLSLGSNLVQPTPRLPRAASRRRAAAGLHRRRQTGGRRHHLSRCRELLLDVPKQAFGGQEVIFEAGCFKFGPWSRARQRRNRPRRDRRARAPTRCRRHRRDWSSGRSLEPQGGLRPQKAGCAGTTDRHGTLLYRIRWSNFRDVEVRRARPMRLRVICWHFARRSETTRWARSAKHSINTGTNVRFQEFLRCSCGG